jgi:hypothetical protein
MVQPLPPRQKTDAQKAVAAMEAESILLGRAKDIADELLRLATEAKSEKVRLEASKYILDRIAGRIPITAPDSFNDKQPWEEVLGTVFREPSKYELDGQIVPPKAND